MSSVPQLTRLRDIADQYDALYCDAWGVIHNGVELLAGAADALRAFRSECGPVVILTNAPRLSDVIPAQLKRIGMPEDGWDEIVTSGDATRAEIEKRLPASIFSIGPAYDSGLTAGLEITHAPLEEAGFIVCTGLFDDRTETPESYRTMFETAVERDLEMICANPDIKVNWGGRMVWCAGALAALYASMGGQVIYSGKPHKPIYSLANKRLLPHLRSASNPRILAIGDGMQTDILGANQEKIDVLFVADDSGVWAGDISEQEITRTFKEHSLDAIGFTEGLFW